MLVVALIVGGLGASTQHPLASTLVARAFGEQRSIRAIGTYNFAGDIGKMTVPAAAALLMTLMPWRPTVAVLGAFGFAAALAIVALMPRQAGDAHATAKSTGAAASGTPRRGFPLLLSIGVLDSGTRMPLLTFLPFLLGAKGASLQGIGLALTLVFAGGACGKLVCAFLGARIGVFATVVLTETATALGIVALLPLPLEACYALLPLIGVALNGTSSVLYGTVPELVPPERRQRAFSIFYTGGVGAGALAPVVYGAASDLADVTVMMLLIAAVVLVTLPLTWKLRPALVRA
jgi:MFS family permease